ncbi:hypothetical protein MIMGU_mgv1a000800mg [Erythranthe guttata]|uniref:NB-ARC domain-containing protein n=1 Tax=Erythranthe guttata TaxID=4155 RepID=A0A022S0M8_ERYGU|nr:hypothetical protein MIMGU_mgv1a000800mg [Erythranthe guttata]
MVDAIVSVVVERLAATLEEKVRKEVNLVRGVEDEIRSLSDDLKKVRNVLEDAEKKGYKDKSVKDWLTRLENTTYEMDDVLDEWNYSVLKFRIEQSSDLDVYVPPKKKVWSSFVPSSCLCFKKVLTRHEIALKIEQVKTRLDLILGEQVRFGFHEIKSQPNEPSHQSSRVQTTSLIDLEEVCARKFESENLVSKLVGGGGGGEELDVSVLSIVGTGGLGKTTLAKLAYNDTRVEKHFELRIWICVSDPFNEVEIAKGIVVASVKKFDNPPNTNYQLEILLQSLKETISLEMVLQSLKESISGKKFLLVLDDVWTEDSTKWESLRICLKGGGLGSRILVTTRNERVALMMGSVKNDIHHLGHLSHEECWLLLSRIALSGKCEKEREKFQNIGREIANKCKGLPLAAKTLGSLLCFKNSVEAWDNVLNSEIWELEEVEDDLFRHLLLSYKELSPTLQRCFSYCAAFPKDTEISVADIIRRWFAMGYLGYGSDWEVRGREYFDKLAMRSLFQDFSKTSNLDEESIASFKMHDIIHDFAQFLRNNVGSRMKETNCQTCSPLLVSQVEKYRSLFLTRELYDPHFCDGLTSVRLLSLRKCGLEGIPEEIEKLIHLRWLDLSWNYFGAENGLKSICKLYNLQFLLVGGCKIKEIPREIGNLIQLKELDLSSNTVIEELPESMCNLRELESLNINSCVALVRLPQGIHRLVNLKHLYNEGTNSLKQYPQGLAQLTNLVTLKKFHNQDGSKLGWLKNLNQLSDSLDLTIKLTSGDDSAEVEDAREVELRKKTRIRNLVIFFNESTMGGEEVMKEASAWNDILDALEPHPNLRKLTICEYKGSRLPRWIASPLNQLTFIFLYNCEYLASLPPLGKLPLLKTLRISGLSELKFVGREFLGITTTTTTSIIGGFPKLEELLFEDCPEWKEWEDITAEEDCDGVSIMPCLTELIINCCDGLTELPQRLMRKPQALKMKILSPLASKAHHTPPPSLQ